MSFFSGRRGVTALLGAVLAVGLFAAPAQAGPRSPDPELPQPSVVSGAATPSASRVVPATIDSDVYAYANTPSSLYFVLAGRLQLQRKSGSTTAYKGSFIDYLGNKSYAASADTTNPIAPKLKLKGKNGSFEFTMNGTFGATSYSGTGSKVPAKLHVPASGVGFGASPHSSSVRSYAIRLTERVGPINDPIEYSGNLTLVYDANGRISGGSATVSNSKGKNVTHALTNSGFSSTGSFYTVAKLDDTYFGLSGTVSGSSLFGNGFGGSGSKTTEWVLSGTA